MYGRRILGVFAIVTSVSVTGVLVARIPTVGTVPRRILDHVFTLRDRITVRFTSASGLLPGDPLMAPDGEGFAVIGRTRDVTVSGSDEIVTFEADPEVLRTHHDGARVVAMHPASNLAWALTTLAPGELRGTFEARLRELWERERSDVLAGFAPELRITIEEIGRAFAERVPGAIERNRGTWEPIVARIRTDIVDHDLSPIFQERVWPRVEEQVGRAAAGIAEEIITGMGFGTVARALWAKTKDTVGVGSETAFATELETALRDKALPVLRKRAPELMHAALGAASEAWKDPAVRDALGRSLDRVMTDPEVAQCVNRIWNDVVNSDPTFREALHAAFARPGLWRPVEGFVKAAEPILNETLQDALLRPDRRGFGDRLTQVLRNLMLRKDRRYALLMDAGALAIDSRAPIPGTRSP